jgi:hypothetical protein
MRAACVQAAAKTKLLRRLRQPRRRARGLDRRAFRAS